MRCENLSYEIQRYKDEVLEIKDQLNVKIEKSHLVLRSEIEDFLNITD
jgi:hypothetical protein